MATLNALLGRDPFAALELPGEIPPQRGLSYSDAEILALLAEDNPELEALAQESEAGKDAVSLMRRQYIPDLGLTLSGDLGGMGKSVMAMLTTPVLRSQAIQASIRQARAELEARRALRRQVESDLKAQTVLMLYDLRNAEREAQLLGGTVIPRLEQAVETSRASYVTGRSSLGDLIEAQRMLLDSRRMLAELRIEREKLLVEIEKLAGMEPEVVSQTESRGAPK
jgi:outer membrane protein TolC